MTVVMAATIMVVLDTTIVNVALHEIGEDLGAGENIEWVVTAYSAGGLRLAARNRLAVGPVRA